MGDFVTPPPAPPATHAGVGDARRAALDDFSRKCIANPGQWAIVDHFGLGDRPSKSASRAAIGAVAYVTRGLQVMVRQSEDGWRMYARWSDD